ncbi:MAG: DUF2752 domain-containing protein [Actinomycetia bacterium]|nr:DUF2752 domain-containing protein [Actinomycetes bacterium]
MVELTTLLLNPRIRSLIVSPWTKLAAATGAFLVAGITASNDDGLILCPLRRCSGGYCPGCGLTRSSGQLLRGDLAGSWRHHPFILLALAQLSVLAVTYGALPETRRAQLRGMTNRMLMANGALLVAIWAARMASGSIPVPFFS